MTKRKQIALITMQIKKMYKEKRALFFMVIFSVMISTYGVFFFTDYLSSYIEQLSNRRGDCLTIGQELTRQSSKSFQNIMKELDYSQISEIICSDSDASKSNIDNEILIKGEYHQNYKKRLLVGRLPEWDSTEPEIVIDEFMAEALEEPDSPVGKKVKIGDTEYKIIGVCSIMDEDEVIVPLTYYLTHFRTNQIQIQFKKELSNHQKEQLTALFEAENFTQIKWRELPKIWTSDVFWKNMWQVMAVFVVIGINIFMLMQYLINKNKRKFCIFSICGGGRDDIATIIFGQIFIPIFIGTMLGFMMAIISRMSFGQLEWFAHKDTVPIYAMIFSVLLGIEIVVSIRLEKVMIQGVELYYVED